MLTVVPWHAGATQQHIAAHLLCEAGLQGVHVGSVLSGRSFPRRLRCPQRLLGLHRSQVLSKGVHAGSVPGGRSVPSCLRYPQRQLSTCRFRVHSRCWTGCNGRWLVRLIENPQELQLTPACLAQPSAAWPARSSAQHSVAHLGREGLLHG